MTETLIASINELLNEEKWTRATLNNYTVNNFKELDNILEDIDKQDMEDEVVELCNEHLHHTKNSIIALYISGVINLSRHLVDDTNLVKLINIFSDNHKWNIVEYLCKRILEFGENKLALRTLAECYNNENQQNQMYEVWERLIKVDFEEADIVKLIAKRKEEEDDIEESVNYYKKALHRYINKKVFNNIRDVWHKLIEYAPEETEYFYHAENKIAKVLSEERAVQLLEDLYPYFQEKANWDIAIDILKKILDYDSKNAAARKQIIECYKNKYSGHSHLDEYIKVSNLNQSWRNVHEAIEDFEKHISFDAGNFVFHRSWGVGRIRSIKDDEIVIDFVKKRKHRMSLKMAVNALNILSKQHIWVLKSVMKREKLKKKIKSDISWTLKMIIKSNDNAADMKKIKSELVPSILSQNEWTSWSSQARKILKEDTTFGNLPDKLDQFVVREQPISYEEKTFNKFKAEKDFFERFKTFNEFFYDIQEQDIGTDSEFFREMFEYFVGFLKTANEINEYVVASNLLIHRLLKRYPYLNPGVHLDFKEMFSKIDNLTSVFARLNDNDVKREFLIQIKRNVKNWPDIYKELFPNYLYRHIVDELEENKHRDKLKELFTEIYNRYREDRESFVWLVRNVLDEDWYKELDIDYEKILISMLHILELTYRDIENRKDVSLNRKINRQIQNYLFKEENLEDYILTADEDSITRLYTLADDISGLDPSIAIELKTKIIEKNPEIKFFGEQEQEIVSRGFITTQKSLEEKQKYLRHIHEVEVPENTKEISEALSHGDLKENAEYKAAKERQDYLNSTVAKLKEDLDRAQVMYNKDVDDSRVSFGTKIKLKNEKSGEEEEYTLLGPWESNPDKQVISYLSPFGNELYNHKEGEEISFSINNRDYEYTILNIESVDF